MATNAKLGKQFEIEYAKLNKAQKEVVESIDGPVMVVAGPGTGKTQVLALRIANILQKTDIKADGILCLTFTNAGVSAMRERLHKYIGEAGEDVNVFTFHSFGMKIIEQYYKVLELVSVPKLMDDADMVMLYDEILYNQEWQYLRPRSDASRYFNDIKSLISLLKKDRISPTFLREETKKDIKNLENNEESFSTRGESKGQLKKEVLKDIEGLNRTLEVVKFFEIYEQTKKEKNLFDYDDVLENLVKIVETSEDALADIREKYLYVLIDEHQDSSGVQNEFLQKVWAEVEKPNIFVVGDDRQLIYGFGGATLAYFESFKHTFGRSKLITLVENYRSTQPILDAADALLQSSLSNEKLISNRRETHKIRFIEAPYKDVEIIAAALDIKEKIKQGVGINDCAILVPKNKQVRNAALILRSMGLPVTSENAFLFFDSSISQSLLRVLRIVANPDDNVSFITSLFDKVSGIDPLTAHRFIMSHDMRKFSLLMKQGHSSLFPKEDPVEIWIEKILLLAKETQTLDLESLLQKVGDALLLPKDIIETLVELARVEKEKDAELNLSKFLLFLERLEAYGGDIPIKSGELSQGVKILTLHGSKGLEFDYVWIAHMDERSLMSGKRQAFMLPSVIQEKVEEKDADVVKRQLYVAITRAKRFCTISYALYSDVDTAQEFAHILSGLPEELIEKKKSGGVEDDREELLDGVTKQDLVKIVSEEYTRRNVSVSLLNNFFECPWKWYFRNLLQLPEPTNESLEFGSAVHNSIDQILKMDKKPTSGEVKVIVENQNLKKHMELEIFNLISNWAEKRFASISLNRENEKSVSLKNSDLPHLNMYGKIDLVEKLASNVFRVTDFKTGSVKKKSEIEKLDEEGRMSGLLRQLAMYSYLLEGSMGGQADVRESRLEFLEAKNPKESFYDRVISKTEIELLKKDIADYDQLVKSGEWINRECNYNSYGRDEECVYCKLAEIYN